MYSYAVA